MGNMFKSGKKTTTTTKSVPDWVQDTSQSALNAANRYAAKPYQPYMGQRVAGLSGNEQQGIDMASAHAGQWQEGMGRSGALLQRADRSFADADMDAYMNPYIKGALDPAAREVNLQTQQQLDRIKGQQASRNAFGGSRGTLLETETLRGGQQTIGDIYKRGFAEAFESGANRWSADREHDRVLAQSEMAHALQGSNLLGQDIVRLMESGAVDRSIRQHMADFDYQQFVEDRDWDLKQLETLLAGLGGIQGSYDTTTTQVDREEGNSLGQIMGLANAAFGVFKGGSGGSGGGLFSSIGAAVGSIFGPIGTAAGGALGGIVDGKVAGKKKTSEPAVETPPEGP